MRPLLQDEIAKQQSEVRGSSILANAFDGPAAIALIRVHLPSSDAYEQAEPLRAIGGLT